jgi:hypothetical protein
MTSTISYQPQTTKLCNKCGITYSTTNFSKDKLNKDGLHTNCKQCKSTSNKLWRKENRDKKAATQAHRRAIKLKSTPIWFEKEEVDCLYSQSRKITEQTGIKHHVDHIVPQQSSIVCGLHCISNLRIIPAKENCSKGNHHWPDMP